MRNKVQLEVPHNIQKHSWDCGISCALSVLKFMGKNTDNVYGDDLKALGCGESVWTVDLAHLMSMHGVKHHFCTTFLGVNKGYAKKSFYARNFTHDEERVNTLFQESTKYGISCEERTVSVDEMFLHLDAGNILVCLVDWKYLECIWCDIKICKSLDCFRSCCESYQGHFVVVCGFDTNNGHIYYKNPSYREELCCSRMEKFNKARGSHGTDEDVLFVFRDKNVADAAHNADSTHASICGAECIQNITDVQIPNSESKVATVSCENNISRIRTTVKDEYISDESNKFADGSKY